MPGVLTDTPTYHRKFPGAYFLVGLDDSSATMISQATQEFSSAPTRLESTSRAAGEVTLNAGRRTVSGENEGLAAIFDERDPAIRDVIYRVHKAEEAASTDP
jgi:hypothetical protein